MRSASAYLVSSAFNTLPSISKLLLCRCRNWSSTSYFMGNQVWNDSLGSIQCTSHCRLWSCSQHGVCRVSSEKWSNRTYNSRSSRSVSSHCKTSILVYNHNDAGKRAVISAYSLRVNFFNLSNASNTWTNSFLTVVLPYISWKIHYSITFIKRFSILRLFSFPITHNCPTSGKYCKFLTFTIFLSFLKIETPYQKKMMKNIFQPRILDGVDFHPLGIKGPSWCNKETQGNIPYMVEISPVYETRWCMIQKNTYKQTLYIIHRSNEINGIECMQFWQIKWKCKLVMYKNDFYEVSI